MERLVSKSSAANLVERKAKRQKMAFKNVQNRKRRKRKWAPTPDPGSKETHLIQKALNLTFECERLHCRLLHKRCIQRQESWNPKIYEGCIGCKQGLKIVKKGGTKTKRRKLLEVKGGV